ncbi:homeodomain mRNAion factor [Fagus crenata]
MAAESNTPGFHHEEAFGSAMNRHAISFQTGAMNSTSEMIPMGNYFGGMNTTGGGGGGGMLFSPGNSSNNHHPVLTQPLASSLLLDSVPGLKHDTGLAVEWSVEEQYILDEGLKKFAEEQSIMRYIKIAATLRDKTVRDVALRCRWMARKRRKAEEHNVGKKVNNRKDKLVESSSKTNIHSVPPLNMAAYSLMMHHMDQNERMPYEVAGIIGPTKHLLEQNAQAFSQIRANLSAYKWQDNLNLFCRTRNNISAVLNDMRDMPGIMSQMPPLPVCINDDLANSILANTT